MKDHYDLHKNGAEVAKWSVLRLCVKTTGNWTQLAEKICYWSRIFEYDHSPYGRTFNKRVQSHQDPKKQRCIQVQNQSDAWPFFFMSMELSTQNSCHKAKLFTRHLQERLAVFDALSEGEKKENCGKWGHGCFIMTMLQLIMPWESRNVFAKNNTAVSEQPPYS